MSGRKNDPVITSYTQNRGLKTIKEGWPGTPLDQFGKFINADGTTNVGFKQAFRFFLERNPQKLEKKNDHWHIQVLKDDAWLNDPGDKIVWLGHASFFIQISGERILIDPIFGNLLVSKRLSEMPVDPHKFLNIDYVLVSHSHFDHCDKKSLKLLSANNPNSKILCGLKLDKLISKWINNPVQTAGWYQQYQTDNDLAITYLPSRHWANRSLFDINTTLWGGFMIQKAGKCIYFSGDSGFGEHFKEIGNLFPDINVALIGAGAYSPKWFMEKNHQDPYHAVEAFNATGGKVFIPFHYGTFDLSEEPVSESEQILTKLNSEGKINNTLRLLKIGESFVF